MYLKELRSNKPNLKKTGKGSLATSVHEDRAQQTGKCVGGVGQEALAIRANHPLILAYLNTG
jgi:hypothetical protein